jgi:hypothetical protein
MFVSFSSFKASFDTDNLGMQNTCRTWPTNIAWIVLLWIGLFATGVRFVVFPFPSQTNSSSQELTYLLLVTYFSTVMLFIGANHDERYGADPEIESETLVRGGLEKEEEKEIGDVVVKLS